MSGSRRFAIVLAIAALASASAIVYGSAYPAVTVRKSGALRNSWRSRNPT
jgi:hypothetical protein